MLTLDNFGTRWAILCYTVYLVYPSLPGAECVEHVEEDEAGEGHGGVPRRHLAVLHHLPEHPQRPADDDGRRQQHVQDQAPVQDLRLGVFLVVVNYHRHTQSFHLCGTKSIK